MPTVTSKELVDEIIKKNGIYSTDPQIHSIVEYQSAFGGTCYGLNYQERNDYTPSDYVLNPRIIFERKE